MPTPLHLTRLTGSHLFIHAVARCCCRFEMRNGFQEEMKRNSSSRVFYSTIPYKASQIHGTLQLSRIYYAAL
jgi:hypothetical protein